MYVRDLVTGTTTLASANAAVVYVRDIVTGTITYVPQESTYSWPVAFSPDNSKLLLGLAGFEITRWFGIYDFPTGTTTSIAPRPHPGGWCMEDEPTGDTEAAFNADGTKVLFVSDLRSYVAPDTCKGDGYDANDDVFAHDLTTGTVTRLTSNAAGTDSSNGFSIRPRFSPDGTAVAFDSDADDFGPTDSHRPPPSQTDVYVKNLASGEIDLVSVNSEGDDSGNRPTTLVGFAGDGHVIMQSAASDLGPNDSDRPASAGWEDDGRDLGTGATYLLSQNADGSDSGNDVSLAAEVSANAPPSSSRAMRTTSGPPTRLGRPPAGVTSTRRAMAGWPTWQRH